MLDHIAFWWRFVTASLRRGWKWIVGVAHHWGAAALILGAGGFIYLSWSNTNGWALAIYLLSVLLLMLSVGAYLEWRNTIDAVAAAGIVNIDATLRQLRGERGRANNWIKQIRESKGEEPADQIGFLFDTFWLQWLQNLIEPRNARLWRGFQDEVKEPIAEVGATKREQVGEKVRLAVKRLDAVIGQLEHEREGLRELMFDDPVKS